MKQSNICPKCKSSDVVHVKNYLFPSTTNVVRLSKWGTQLAHYDRYICADCGYMEEYLDVQEKSWVKWLEEQRANNTLDSDFV